MSRIAVNKTWVAGMALMASALIATADEPQLLLEEVTVIGAVRSSESLGIADIDVAGDEQLAEMPIAYE